MDFGVPMFDGGVNDDSSDADNGKSRVKRVSRWQSDWLCYLSVIATIICFLSAAGALTLVLVDDDFTLRARIVADRRSRLTSTSTDLIVVQTSLGVLNLGIFAALTSAAAFVAFLVNTYLHDVQVGQINNGGNPWVWVNMAIWHVPAWLLYTGLVQPALSSLILVPGLALAWIAVWYTGDLLNSDAVRATFDRAYDQYGARSYNWIPLVITVVLFLVAATTQIIGIVDALSTPTDAAGVAAGAPIPTSIAVVAIVGLVLYLLVPIVIALHLGGFLINSVYWRDFVLYIVILIFVLVTTWLPIIVFFYDGVSPNPASTK